MMNQLMPQPVGSAGGRRQIAGWYAEGEAEHGPGPSTTARPATGRVKPSSRQVASSRSRNRSQPRRPGRSGRRWGSGAGSRSTSRTATARTGPPRCPTGSGPPVPPPPPAAPGVSLRRWPGRRAPGRWSHRGGRRRSIRQRPPRPERRDEAQRSLGHGLPGGSRVRPDATGVDHRRDGSASTTRISRLHQCAAAGRTGEIDP